VQQILNMKRRKSHACHTTARPSIYYGYTIT